MSRKVTEDFLKNEVWWWRSGSNQRPARFSEKDLLAFNYELVRRALRKECFPKFPVVESLCRYAIPQFAGEEYEERTFRFSRTPETGWMEFPASIQWNLKKSDRALKEAFMRFIRDQRKVQGVGMERSKKRKSTRHLPWRWLELMDFAHYRIRSLEDNERSSLSMARKAAQKKVEAFITAVDQFGEQQRVEGQSRTVNWPEEYLVPAPKQPMKLFHGVWPTERKNRSARAKE